MTRISLFLGPQLKSYKRNFLVGVKEERLTYSKSFKYFWWNGFYEFRFTHNEESLEAFDFKCSNCLPRLHLKRLIFRALPGNKNLLKFENCWAILNNQVINQLHPDFVAAGLFKRAILMSGSAMSADAIGKAPLQITKQVKKDATA